MVDATALNYVAWQTVLQPDAAARRVSGEPTEILSPNLASYMVAHPIMLSCRTHHRTGWDPVRSHDVDKRQVEGATLRTMT